VKDECTNGAKQCSGRVPQTCSGGVWTGSTECSSDKICSGGSCTACASGKHVYQNTCEANDNNHCGTHTTTCSESQNCNTTSGSSVAVSCTSTQHVYNHGCENNDNSNCGAHGNECSAKVIANGTSFRCLAGTCLAIDCQDGYHLENGMCYKRLYHLDCGFTPSYYCDSDRVSCYDTSSCRTTEQYKWSCGGGTGIVCIDNSRCSELDDPNTAKSEACVYIGG
jgi:hypothetical protein